jgi:hypothetical protein
VEILTFAAGVCVGAFVMFLALNKKESGVVVPTSDAGAVKQHKVAPPDNRKAYQFSDPSYKNELKMVTRKVSK